MPQPMRRMTPDQMRAFAPKCPHPDRVAAALNIGAERFGIDTAQRFAHWIAQLAVESTEFTQLEEDLSLSASELANIWPDIFADDATDAPTALARDVADAQERIANVVYANRIGNGDEASGDGWRFHGRGPLRIVGRGNYRAAGTFLGLPLEDDPESVAEIETGALVAGWFWMFGWGHDSAGVRCSFNALADDDNTVAVMRAISGGYADVDSCEEYVARAKRAIGLVW